MILIISNNQDKSTYDVIKWLESKSKKYIRISDQDTISISYVLNDINFTVKNKYFKLSQITSVWYRRGMINNTILTKENIERIDDTGVLQFLGLEEHTLKEYLYYILTKKRHINSFPNRHVNKLIICEMAQDIGLKVPKSYIVDNKKSLLSIKKELITKTIYGYPVVEINNINKTLTTEIVNPENVTQDFFFPTLLQDNITKKYEVRAFYFNETFFSMAIFSQLNDESKIDFRQKIPPRNVPYKLPIEIENKLSKLMKSIPLNSGSIDIIVDHKNNYYFLEVNPVGQFGMVSIPCNYNLEKKIADYLSEEN